MSYVEDMMLDCWDDGDWEEELETKTIRFNGITTETEKHGYY